MNLQQVLDELNLTIYGAAQIIGAETDEPLKTVHQRWSQWLKTTPKTIAALEQDLEALGYMLTIEKQK